MNVVTWRKKKRTSGKHTEPRKRCPPPPPCSYGVSGTQKNVAVGDIVCVADRNALRSQYKLGKVIKANADSKCIVRDVDVRVFSSHPVFCSGPKKVNTKTIKNESTKIPSAVLHRDVHRLVVLIPVEKQSNQKVWHLGFQKKGCQVGGVELET